MRAFVPFAASLLISVVVNGPRAHAAPPPASGSPSPSSAGCAPVPACPEIALEPGAPRPFRRVGSRITTSLGAAHHRARDLFQAVGAAQWLSAKFTYGKAHKDLEGEEVDVWLLRGCAGAWEKIGTFTTDHEGRVRTELAKDRALAAGIHRIRFVVAGDGSATDAVAEILDPTTKFFVSDIDGTLTSSEHAEVGHVVTGSLAETHPDAARALGLLAERGYRPLYLSARADWLSDRTHRFLAFHGFPHGAIRITNSKEGLSGERAKQFKSSELAVLVQQGLVPSFGFGNKPSDTEAYEAGKVARRFFLNVGDPHGGKKIASYTEILPELRAVGCSP